MRGLFIGMCFIEASLSGPEKTCQAKSRERNPGDGERSRRLPEEMSPGTPKREEKGLKGNTRVLCEPQAGSRKAGTCKPVLGGPGPESVPHPHSAVHNVQRELREHGLPTVPALRHAELPAQLLKLLPTAPPAPH
jgi:hypothetical protein